jgi:hypothetical protein
MAIQIDGIAIVSDANAIPYVEAGTHLFRFMDHRTDYFWPTVSEMLSEHRLFLNSRTRFNDPYDSRPIIDNDLSNSAIRDYVDDMVANPYNRRRKPSQIARIVAMRDSGRTLLRKGSIQNIKEGLLASANEFLDTSGLLSFSLTAENPLLWGYYAASFAGICTVFKRSTSGRSALSICARVAYVDQRPRLALSKFHAMAKARMAGQSYDDLANEIFFRSFLHKSNHWSHEKEARIFCPSKAFEKIEFGSDELIGFILGVNTPASVEEKLNTEIRLRKPTVAVHRSSLSRSEFKVVIPHILTRRSAKAA